MTSCLGATLTMDWCCWNAEHCVAAAVNVASAGNCGAGCLRCYSLAEVLNGVGMVDGCPLACRVTRLVDKMSSAAYSACTFLSLCQAIGSTPE